MMNYGWFKPFATAHYFINGMEEGKVSAIQMNGGIGYRGTVKRTGEVRKFPSMLEAKKFVENGFHEAALAAMRAKL